MSILQKTSSINSEVCAGNSVSPDLTANCARFGMRMGPITYTSLGGPFPHPLGPAARQAGFAAMIADLRKPLREASVVPISTLLAANLACQEPTPRCHFSRRTFLPAKGLKSTDKIKPNTHQTFLKHHHVRPYFTNDNLLERSTANLVPFVTDTFCLQNLRHQPFIFTPFLLLSHFEQWLLP